MEIEEKLNYAAYVHQYREGDILSLKDSNELENINQILLENYKSIDYLSGTIWYLTKEKQEPLMQRKLKVVNTISWHFGIPFYILEDPENDSFLFTLAEFYLLN